MVIPFAFIARYKSFYRLSGPLIIIVYLFDCDNLSPIQQDDRANPVKLSRYDLVRASTFL